MNIPIVYQDDYLLAVNKPANLIVFPEGNMKGKTLIEYLLDGFPDLKNCGEPPRYGIIHKLDKDTSGIVLVAKTNQALNFLQKQFKPREVVKTYIALLCGTLKENSGKIDELMGRADNGIKQSIYPAGSILSEKVGARRSITFWKVLKRFEGFTLVAARPKTGRKHQLRAQFAYLNHPVAGDKLYSFKNQTTPVGLTRHFLHAYKLKVRCTNGETKIFTAPLPEELKIVIQNLKQYETN